MSILRNRNHRLSYQALVLIIVVVTLTLGSTRLRADTGTCNGASVTLPFTDVPASNGFFCSIASAYITGLTNGTSATTYGPSQNVSRDQMAAFVSRTHDSAIRRSSRRAVAQQWWTSNHNYALTSASLFNGPGKIAWDGIDFWVPNTGNNTVRRLRAGDGKELESYQLPWPGQKPHDVISVAGYIFVTGMRGPGTPGVIYRIETEVPDIPGAVLNFAETGPNPSGITFDGENLWTANNAGGLIGGSITKRPLGASNETFTTGFVAPSDVLWDGENLWVADYGADRVRRVDPATGAVLQSIVVGNAPRELLFDGSNLWVSNYLSDNVTVIRAVGALRGTVLATLTGNGLDGPAGLAFDGERVLVTNFSGDSVSLFKAADLTPMVNVSTSTNSDPLAACSDGLNFWIVRLGKNDLLRF